LGEEVFLVLGSFEHSVTHLGGCADPLQFYAMLIAVWKQCLTQYDGSLLCAWAGASNHNEITFDNSIVYPAAERVDAFFSGVHLSLAAGCILGSVHQNNQFINFCSMEVTHLTSTSTSILDVCWVPGTDAGHFSVTSSGLSRKSGDVPPVNDAFKSAAAG